MTDFPCWPYIVRNAIQGNTPGYAIYKVSFVKFIPEDFETGNSFEKLQAELDRLTGKGTEMTEAELKKHRDKCKDCAHAQKCCGFYYLCTIRNYDMRHGNTNACMNFKRKEQNND